MGDAMLNKQTVKVAAFEFLKVVGAIGGLYVLQSLVLTLLLKEYPGWWCGGYKKNNHMDNRSKRKMN